MSAGEWMRRVPWAILACASLLMLAGWAGIRRADELAGAGDYARRQLLWMAIGMPLMFAVTWIPYRRFREWSFPLFLTALAGLLVVFLMPAVNGSHRWVPLRFMNLQPSELAKIAYVLALAHYLMHRRNYRRLWGLLMPFLLTTVPLGLILREPDLGTSLLFVPVLFAMLFAAGARLWHLGLVVALGVAVSPVMWMGMSAEQRSRVVTIFRQQDGGPAPRGDGYQLHQSKQVLALGGPWGSDVTGMLRSDPMAYHLPAGRTDFVFCMIGERWGLWGTLSIVAVYLVLFAEGLRIAGKTQEPFGRLIAVGIVALLASQTLINLGMTVGLMPITGMTLPLVSYGGSSLLATCLALGLLMNVGMRPGYEVSGEPFRFQGREL
jgi:cell division protein FtsW (lipid II flippase)